MLDNNTVQIEDARSLKRYAKVAVKIRTKGNRMSEDGPEVDHNIEKGAFLRAIKALNDDAPVTAQFTSDAEIHLTLV